MKTYNLPDLKSGITDFKDGDLYLYGCTSLTSLPDGLKVGGDLDLYNCTSLTSLPDGLEVGGYLGLSGCTSLTCLPNGLKVGGDLNLYSCTSLTSLPDGLKVGGYLDLSYCDSLTSLPDDMIVKGTIYGVDHLKVEKKMSCLNLTGNCYCRECKELATEKHLKSLQKISGLALTEEDMIIAKRIAENLKSMAKKECKCDCSFCEKHEDENLFKRGNYLYINEEEGSYCDDFDSIEDVMDQLKDQYDSAFIQECIRIFEVKELEFEVETSIKIKGKK